MAVTLTTSARDTLCNAIVDMIDNGASAGLLEFYVDGGVLLAELVFSDPAFGASSSGTATANAITQDTSANATGIVGIFLIKSSDDIEILRGTVSASGGDINFNTTSITQGDGIVMTALTVTVPAS